MTTAIQLSDKFVPSGTIVATRGRDASDNMVEYAQRQQTWKLPLVVLVDENSASASEIFAAAVQENGAASSSAGEPTARGPCKPTSRSKACPARCG